MLTVRGSEKRKGGICVLCCGFLVVFYPLTMAFMVGLRFRLWLMAIFAVSGSRSIVIMMAQPLCMLRWGLRRTLMLLLGTFNVAVEPSGYVALAVSTCILIMV